MSPRYVLLVVASVAVFGLGVYLFMEVRSAPAASVAASDRAREPAHTPEPPAPREDETEDVGPPPQTGPALGGPRNVAARRGETEPAIPPTDNGDLHVGESELAKANPKLDAIMAEANRAYDEQDFDEARAIASKVLSKQPQNIRMLRVMVSSACITGDKDIAQKYFDKLPKFDRDQMKQRCDRYGIAFRDPAQ